MTGQSKRYYIGDIIAVASEVFGLHPNHITGRNRHRRHFVVRAAVAHIARELTPLSLPQIGRFLGGRDHSSICHSIDRARQLIETSPDYAAMVNEVVAMLQDRPAQAIMLAELRRERELKKAMAEALAAAAEAADAKERAERLHWHRVANGNKIRAQVLHKRERLIAKFTTDAKPKNDFFACDGLHDDAHYFHAMMAEGSAALRDAIQTARLVAA